jgi:hypothetical protein
MSLDGGHEAEVLLGAYALDAVDERERAAVEDHLRECPVCRADLAGFREVASLLAQEGGPAPSNLWPRIVAALEAEPPPLRMPPPPEVGAESAAVPRLDEERRRRRGVPTARVVAAAASVLVAVLGVVVVLQRDEINRDAVEVADADLEQAANRALADPTNVTAVLQPPPDQAGAPATVVLTRSGTGFLLTPHLDGLPGDRTYQLWGVVGDRVISLGVLGADPSVSVFEVDPKAPLDGLAVTDEAVGGVVSSESQPALVWTA